MAATWSRSRRRARKGGSRRASPRSSPIAATRAVSRGPQRLGLAAQIVPAQDYPDRAAFEAALQAALATPASQLVALAGFMRILSASFVEHYAGRMLNIHPSLLPRYKGLHTHRRVLQAAEHEHGASVHFVTAELDGGPVICQARLAVRAGRHRAEPDGASAPARTPDLPAGDRPDRRRPARAARPDGAAGRAAAGRAAAGERGG